MTTTSGESPPDEKIVWSSVEAGFYVATVEGRFLGFVDEIDVEKFQVCDASSQQIGLFTSLDVAMELLAQRSRADDAAVGSAR